MTSVANDLATHLTILGSMRIRKLWLQANKDPNARDENGRPREEVYSLYLELWKMHVQYRKSSAILEEIRAFFDSPEVVEALEREQKVVDAFSESATPAEIQERVKEESKARDALLRAMGAEVRRPVRRA